MRNFAACLFLSAAVSACSANPPKNIPIHATAAAIRFCPASECSSVRVGPSSKRLAYTSAYFDRWCIEVTYEKGGQKRQAAVDVYQVESDPVSPFSWSASDPIYNSDCSAFD